MSKTLKTIEEGLIARGLGTEDVESFMEELETNDYDYDAVVEDVGDKEQSMLLDFFRDILHDEKLFDVLVDTLEGKKIPKQKIEKAPQEIKKKKKQMNHQNHPKPNHPSQPNPHPLAVNTKLMVLLPSKMVIISQLGQ
eukprot:186742_1